jgi:hypothetical protein
MNPANTVTRIPEQAGLPRLALCATLDLCLPTKQELRGALSAETDSEDRNTLTNPLTLADRQTWVVARAPRDLLLLAVSPCARSEFASSASAR